MSLKKAAYAFFFEIKMGILTSFRYKFSLISDIVVFSVFMAFFLSGNVGLSFAEKYGFENYKILTLLGYIAWTMSVAAISSSTDVVSMELSKGIFYRKLNSVCSIQLLLFADMIASLMVEMVVLFGLLVIANIVWHVVIPFKIIAIIAIGICTIGMYGIGLILSGLAIRLKRIGSIVLLVQTILLFVTDTIPTSKVVTNITAILPLTRCNTVIRLNVSGQSCSKELLCLLIVSVIWFFIGNLIFVLFVKFTKKKGNLLHY